MRLPPTPWSEYETVQFRLAGFGGAAVFLRTSVAPGVLVDLPHAVLVMDFSFLSPSDRFQVLNRPVGGDLDERLSGFLFSAAEDFHPEKSVSALQDELSGLVVTVEYSTDDRVCLDWKIIQDPSGTVREFFELNFETTRAALISASHEALLLRNANPDDFMEVDY